VEESLTFRTKVASSVAESSSGVGRPPRCAAPPRATTDLTAYDLICVPCDVLSDNKGTDFAGLGLFAQAIADRSALRPAPLGRSATCTSSERLGEEPEISRRKAAILLEGLSAENDPGILANAAHVLAVSARHRRMIGLVDRRARAQPSSPRLVI